MFIVAQRIELARLHEAKASRCLPFAVVARPGTTSKPALRNRPIERGMWKADVTSTQVSPGRGIGEFAQRRPLLMRVAGAVFQNHAAGVDTKRLEQTRAESASPFTFQDQRGGAAGDQHPGIGEAAREDGRLDRAVAPPHRSR